MNKQAVFAPDLQCDLPHGLQKWLRFNVTDRAADFGDDDIGVGLLADAIDEVLDFIGDVRDYLYGRAEVFAAPFLVFSNSLCYNYNYFEY